MVNKTTAYDPAPPDAKLTLKASDLQLFLDCRAERLELDRKSAVLAAKEKALRSHFQEFLHANSQTSAKRGAFRVFLGSKKGRVSWKDVVVDKLGSLFAHEVIDKTPDVVTVDVEKV